MIPKTIHYCWFGRNPLPPLAERCMASWRKFMPDYEIKVWNEDNFDVNAIPYTAEAYKAKKYAFVSDYARFWIVFNYGGVYFDTDVEVIKPMDDILANGAYMGFEWNPGRMATGYVNPGLGFAAERGNTVIGMIMRHYCTLHFNGTSQTVVHHATNILVGLGLEKKVGIQCVGGINIYPSEFFAPIHFVTHRIHITENTHTVHQYMASWSNKQNLLGMKIKDVLPEWVLLLYSKFKHPNLY